LAVVAGDEVRRDIPDKLRGGFEPLGLSAFTDVVPPAFASCVISFGDEVMKRQWPVS
jgi:hypothetical protein